MFEEEVNLGVRMDKLALQYMQCFSLVLKYTLFSFKGVIELILDCIDRLHQYSSGSHFTEPDTGEEWEAILNNFYELLGEN